MKIDKVYVFCCKKDLYLTRICVASIRYWNESVPIEFVKDLSQGDFDTRELETVFGVSVAPIGYRNLSFYSKLYPFMLPTGERALLIDSDIVWAGNLLESLESFREDIIVEGYTPREAKTEMQKWFFNLSKLKENYPDYEYPGYLFNCGQLVVNTSKFSEADFSDIIEWKENMAPLVPGIFVGEDQGILNYVISRKIRKNEISLRSHHFFLWGWSEEAREIRLSNIKLGKPYPFLIHWYGAKNGLVSFLPNAGILKFYEAFYYSKIKHGTVSMYSRRISRTIRHFRPFLFELSKKIYFSALSPFRPLRRAVSE